MLTCCSLLESSLATDNTCFVAQCELWHFWTSHCFFSISCEGLLLQPTKMPLQPWNHGPAENWASLRFAGSSVHHTPPACKCTEPFWTRLKFKTGVFLEAICLFEVYDSAPERRLQKQECGKKLSGDVLMATFLYISERVHNNFTNCAADSFLG